MPPFFINMNCKYVKVNLEGMDKLTFTEKAVLSYVKSLCKGKGYCFASNKHICDTLSLKDRTLYRILNRLERSDFIRRETRSIGNDGKQRKIYVNPSFKL